MADTKQILHHIAELYSKPKKDQTPQVAIAEYEEKLNLRYDDYEKAFSEFFTGDLIRSIDNFWRFHSDKTRPKLVEITAFLRADEKTETTKNVAKYTSKTIYSSLEADFMQMNKTSSLYKKYLHNDYTRAIKYVLDELLPEKIGRSEFLRVRGDYNAKVNLAKRNGLFADFNSLLVLIYNRHYGIVDETDNLANVAGF